MNYGNMTLAAAIVSMVLLFTLVLYVCREKDGRTEVLGTYLEWKGMLRDRSQSETWYQLHVDWLTRRGVSFHYGKWMDPLRFIAVSALVGLAGFIIGSLAGYWCGLVAFVFGCMLPAGLLLHLNKQDNLRMLPELKLVYHSLEIQTRAGVYLTDALAECYGSVHEPRLRQALLDLAGDIVLKADIADSLEKLQAKFDNRYVDSLCIIIMQAMESGQAIELLRDISEQIKDMEEIMLQQKKASMDRKITFLQLGVLTVCIGVALYACVIYMFSASAKL